MDLYHNNYSAIHNYERIYPNLAIHNYNIANNDLLSFMNSNTLSDLFNRQQNSFAINISIGFIPFNNTTGEFRYFHTSQNGIGRMFERPVHVTNRESFDIFLERVQNRDFWSMIPEANQTVAGWYIVSQM